MFWVCGIARGLEDLLQEEEQVEDALTLASQPRCPFVGFK